MSSNQKIAKQYIRGNKKQNRILHLGLCSLCVFSIVLLLFQASFLKYRQEENLKKYGTWSGAIYNGSNEAYKFLTQSKDIQKLGKITVFENVTVYEKEFSAYIGEIDQDAFQLGKIQMLEGRLPQQEDEIVLDQYLLKQIAPDAKVGDSVTIPVRQSETGSVASYDFVLSGITDKWGENWDKANYPLPSVLISGNHFLSGTPEKITHYFFLGDEEQDYAIGQLEEFLKTHSDSIYIYNAKTYSSSLNAEDKFFQQRTFIAMICALSLLVLCFFLSMVASKMQYRITIMRNLGAEITTVYSIFMWEAFYLWRTGMLLGIGTGVISSAIIICIIKFSLHLDLPLAINWADLGIALLFLSAAFLFSYFLITFDSVFVRIRTSYREDNSSIRNQRLPELKKIRPMTVSRLYKRFFRFYPKRSLLKVAISVIAVLTLNLNIITFLGHYERYRNIETSYDYSLTIYDMDKCLDSDQIKRIEETPGIISVEAEKVFFSPETMITVSWDGWKKSQYINTLAKYSYGTGLISDEDKKEGGRYYLSNISGFHPENTKLMDWYESCIDEGSLDPEKFRNGEQCVLFLSPYSLQFSEMIDKKYEVQPLIDITVYDKVSKVYEYENDENSIKPGDTITISSGDATETLEIGGIVRSVTGLPPVSTPGVAGSGVLAVSNHFIEKISGISPTQYNILKIQSYVNADHSETDWQLQSLLDTMLGNDDGESFLFDNHRESCEIILNLEMTGMVKSAFIIIITVLILGFILYQGTTGKLQNEEKRIRILHSLGMSRKKIQSMYWLETALEGFCSGLLGMLLAGLFQFGIWKRESGYTKFTAIIDAAVNQTPANAYIVHIYAATFLLYFIIYLLLVTAPTKHMLKRSQKTMAIKAE